MKKISNLFRLNTVFDPSTHRAEPLQQIKIQPLGVIVRSFKSAATKLLHQTRTITQEKVWQRNYYEHIIWDEDDFQQIVDYIASNPFNWDFDHENPGKI